jgi:hypothetical protein
MLYMFLLYWNESAPPMPPEEAITRHFAFTDQMRARNAYVYSEAIGGASTATTVRVRDGKTMLTDGPFAESKEVMGGFYVLDCRDLDDALELAAQMPDASALGVEVRPVMGVPGWDYGPTADRQRVPMG